MNKASHIKVSRFILNDIDNIHLQGYRKSFYLGSILPDCIPSFLTRKHTIKNTLGIVEKEIVDIVHRILRVGAIDRYVARHLGIVVHYIADYFTLPHNETFEGGLVKHCKWEYRLNKLLKETIGSAKNTLVEDIINLHNENISRLIKRYHDEYMRKKDTIAKDCKYILMMCRNILEILLEQIFNYSSTIAVTGIA